MAKTLFLAGASGVIGRRLAPLLVADGWRVVGTTRSHENEPMLRELGVEPIVLNIFNAGEVHQTLAKVKPEIVMNQLSDLPDGLNPDEMPEALVRNARVRDEGTRNLVSAAVGAGVQRIIAQSLAFVYAEGLVPHNEDDPLDVAADGLLGTTVRGVLSLERQVLQAPLEGLILRYGLFYGHGTGFDSPAHAVSVHVDAAARAAELSVEKGAPGIYNITDDNDVVSSEKAKRTLDWEQDWRII